MNPKANNDSYTFLPLLFFILSGLSLLFGLILFSKLLPGDAGYGNTWKAIAYIPSLTWLIVGIVQSSFFLALGQGLHLLQQISRNTITNQQINLEQPLSSPPIKNIDIEDDFTMDDDIVKNMASEMKKKRNW